MPARGNKPTALRLYRGAGREGWLPLFAVSRAHTRVYQQLYSMIDNFKAQDIKDAANIVDVVSDFVQLKRSGSEYTGRCPFHEDRHTGSFMVSPKKNIATCFPCGKTWDPIGFVQEITGLSYPDALRYLAEKYGISTGENTTARNSRT